MSLPSEYPNTYPNPNPTPTLTLTLTLTFLALKAFQSVVAKKAVPL